MHKRQEFTHSTFAFRKAVDGFGLEARYLYVLVTAIAGQGQGGEGAASSFCPSLDASAKLLPSCSSQQHWKDVQ